MELLKSKKTPRRVKISDLLHFLATLALPGVIFLLASQWQLYTLALALVLLSKWRILAVQPRFWWANIQANLVDIIVGVSIVGLMYQASGNLSFQIAWAFFYAIWLVVLKPQAGNRSVAMQAAVGQFLGITALFWYADQLSDVAIIVCSCVIGYAVARHAINSYEEDLLVLLAAIWALFVAQLAWLLNRWLVVYDIGHEFLIPQIALILLIVGYCAAHLYDYSKQGKLTAQQVRSVFGFGGLLLFLVLTFFSNWSGSV